MRLTVSDDLLALTCRAVRKARRCRDGLKMHTAMTPKSH